MNNWKKLKILIKLILITSKKNIFNKLFFLIFFLLNYSFSFANVDPYCNNIISQDLLYKIDHTKPQLIEIEIHDNRGWQKNNLAMVMDVAKQENVWVIKKKYKKNFKATLHVKFNDKIKCSFQAKVRQHGDYGDHIQLVNGKIFQSLNVDLKTGHINGITNFILFKPLTRKSPEDEIFLTELLRELDFLAPRTSFIKVNVNNLTLTMLFQEKAEKELLEYNLRREGPILEGDERYRESFGKEIAKVQLARQTNTKWAAKGIQHQKISHEALTQLNWFYLLTQDAFSDAKYFNILYNVNLDNNLLALNNPDQFLKLNIYNSILWVANGYHGLIPHNRKFYWNAINNYFEPIYYDGDLIIDRTFSQPLNFELVSYPEKNSFLTGINEAKKKIKKIKIENFFEKIKFRGSQLSKSEVKKKLNQMNNNLINLEAWINNEKEEIKLQNNNASINDGVLTNYIDATLKIGSDFYLVFKDPNNKSFKVCKNATLNCNKINLTNDEIIDLLRGRLTINNHIYQYIGEYFDVRDDLATSELNKTQLIKYNKVKLQNTNFYFDKNITFKYDEENSIFDIYQKYSGARAYFLGGNLNNVSINFFGLPKTIDKPLNNYPFDKKGLTGCLSFIDLNLQNVSIKSSDSNCEDAVNLINTTGNIKKFESKNSAKDALDIDFSNIKINGVSINKAGNDCVDLSSGKYEFVELDLSECGDKALSVGEKSLVKLKNFQVLQSKIGLSSKDSSITHIENAMIKNTELCIEAKRKKQEFSGGVINLNNHNCNDSPINIHSGSFINYY